MGGRQGATRLMTVRVATLNCRNRADRWRERAGLLVDQLVRLEPDVIGLQELRRFPSQAAWIAETVGARTGVPHWLHCTPKTGLWSLWEGIAILTRLPILERDALALGGQDRVANFVRVALPGGGGLDFYNTHLATGGAELREAQVSRILAWMGTRPGTPQVLVGDFNAAPTARSIQLVRQSLGSAYASVHGGEPPRTVPTPLRPTAAPSRGAVLDYVFVNDRVSVRDAWVTFDRPHPDDPTLYPSDHYGLAAAISLAPEG